MPEGEQGLEASAFELGLSIRTHISEEEIAEGEGVDFFGGRAGADLGHALLVDFV